MANPRGINQYSKGRGGSRKLRPSAKIRTTASDTNAPSLARPSKLKRPRK